MSSYYLAYGMTIDSEIHLPELLVLQYDGINKNPDIIISFGSISSDGLSTSVPYDANHQLSPSSVWLNIPDVCRFLISNGNSIIIDPVPEVDERHIRMFLLGSAFGAILFQRGLLVLHGNVIKVGDACMVCVGESGSGKSTLAVGFMQRGFDILADDVAPIDAHNRAIPGFPRIKIWQEAADRLGVRTQDLDRIYMREHKFNLPIEFSFGLSPVPVKWVFILTPHEQKDIVIEPIGGANIFGPLFANTYRNHYLDGMGLKSRHLQLCANLSKDAKISKVTRPVEGFELERLMDRLINHTQLFS